MAQPQGTKVTFDHQMVKKWTEEREGKPAKLKDGDIDSSKSLKIKFPELKTNELELISWDEFFNDFDEEELAFQFQDETADGEVSRYYKLIQR